MQMAHGEMSMADVYATQSEHNQLDSKIVNMLHEMTLNVKKEACDMLCKLHEKAMTKDQ